jgi:predicted RNA-binding protein associated with RNAse of E/G family
MKRKFADRPNWKRVLSRKMIIEKFNEYEFTGNAVLIKIEKVRESLWVDLGGKKQCVVDDGYSWLTLFPESQSYVVTAMFNQRDEVVQWYIDICKNIGLTEKNIPWYDDLYLDIIISSDYHISLIDEDDLALALKQNIIKQEDFDFAYQEANKLLEQLNSNGLTLLNYSREIHSVLKKKLEIQK